MARKANLRRKIDRNLKRRASMEERKAYRKKIEEAEQRAKENKERKMKEKSLELGNSQIKIQFKKYQVWIIPGIFSYLTFLIIQFPK